MVNREHHHIYAEKVKVRCVGQNISPRLTELTRRRTDEAAMWGGGRSLCSTWKNNFFLTPDASTVSLAT